MLKIVEQDTNKEYMKIVKISCNCKNQMEVVYTSLKSQIDNLPAVYKENIELGTFKEISKLLSFNFFSKRKWRKMDGKYCVYILTRSELLDLCESKDISKYEKLYITLPNNTKLNDSFSRINYLDKAKTMRQSVKICHSSGIDCFKSDLIIRRQLEGKSDYVDGYLIYNKTSDYKLSDKIHSKIERKLQEVDGIACSYLWVSKEADSDTIYIPIV